MKSCDVLILGASAAGIAAAKAVKGYYPDKTVYVFRDVEKSVVPCGIPYVYGDLGSVDKDIIPDDLIKGTGAELFVDRAVDGDLKEKVIRFESGEEVKYDKLILTVGSHPFVPPIPGRDLKNVFTVKKDTKAMQEIFNAVNASKDIVIIGGGFIGVEMAEQFSKLSGKNITIVEMLPHCLLLAMEEEFAIMAEDELKAMGVNLVTGSTAKAINGSDKVESVELEDGKKIPADMVLIGIGAAPNTSLAEKLGLSVDPRMGVQVDEAMQTSDPNVFAAGDCASKFSFITGKPAPIRLASVASVEGFMAGFNTYAKDRMKTKGAVGAFATKIGNRSFASAGLTTSMCRDNGIDYYEGNFTGPDRHPAGFSDVVMDMKVKLIFRKSDDKLIGGDVVGGIQAADMGNIIAACIQAGYTVHDLVAVQFATHPKLTASPLTYHVYWAAENALRNR